MRSRDATARSYRHHPSADTQACGVTPLRWRKDAAADRAGYSSQGGTVNASTTAVKPCSEAGHDILEHVAVSVPCSACGDRYSVTLRHVLLAQNLMHEGCPVHDDRECPPLVYAPLAASPAIEALRVAWTGLAEQVRQAGWELTLLGRA
jgi:hypothetical protein